jgi:gliding motility-associated-like protein
MKYRLLLTVAALIIFVNTTAQPPETIYLGDVAKSGYANNVLYGPFDIGFSFTFYGDTYTQFYVSSNGLVTFGAGSTAATEDPIPTAATPNNFIAAFWDDLVIDPSGSILYTTIGAAPNRELIIQFRNMGFYPFPVYMGTFTTILNETTNIIQVQYRLTILNALDRTHGGSATIGIENADGSNGVQFAYHDPSAVSTGKAITFTPAGSTYTLNSNATYDGVYLTTNITLPEPGILSLISPADNAIIGTNQTFEWSASSNTSSYSLKLSTNSDLSAATSYDAGSNLSYNIPGLLLNTTYYWGVFATNATGFTWCEVEKFTTSATPPIAPTPQTIWIEQGQEITINLAYSGGDASTKTAIITSLPAQGSLYQYNAGVKGSLISSVPATVSDPDRNVIYVANGSTGNGAGSFNYKIHDNTGDSPEGLVTVNVNPPGIPFVLLSASSTYVEIQLDRPMADPTGKQDQFTVKVDGTPVTINSVSLKTGDPYTIVLTLNTPLTGPATILVSYIQGDVSSTSGGLLASFIDQPVTLSAQTITFPVIPDKIYGDPPFTLSATSSSGLGIAYSSSNLTIATINSNIVTIRTAGTLEITARQAGNVTYAPAKYIRVLTINKADLTFTAENKTRPYFDPNPVFSYLISGFVAGEDQTVLNVLPAIGTSAVQNSPVGDYPITFSGGNDNNYNFIFIPGVLTITKISQTITFTDVPQRLLVGDSYTLVASSTSGLPVLFESSNTQVATVSGNQLTGVSKGNVQIRAYHPGDQNYTSAETFATVEVYSTHKDIIHLFTPNNDGFNDLWEIPELASYGKCDVRIYNRWGKLVFSSPDYNNTWNGTSNGTNLPEGAYYYVIKTQNSGTITGTVNILR